MASYRVEMDRAMCISCGSCVDYCPQIWEMADDGLSSIKDSENEGDIQKKDIPELGCSVEAAEKCPVTCIHVFEDEVELI